MTTPQSDTGTRVRNLLIALVAIALSVALGFGLKTQKTGVTLTQLDLESTPIEVAMRNGKPTLMEFYANWCSSCQAMAPDIAQMKQQYGDAVNFVMLNVDNTKWLPEISQYQVDGIPHFVFFNKKAEAIAQSIGEQPHRIMASNLEALINDKPLPYAQSTKGQVSKFSAPGSPTANQEPRLHSSQVVN